MCALSIAYTFVQRFSFSLHRKLCFDFFSCCCCCSLFVCLFVTVVPEHTYTNQYQRINDVLCCGARHLSKLWTYSKSIKTPSGPITSITFLSLSPRHIIECKAKVFMHTNKHEHENTTTNEKCVRAHLPGAISPLHFLIRLHFQFGHLKIASTTSFYTETFLDTHTEKTFRPTKQLSIAFNC